MTARDAAPLAFALEALPAPAVLEAEWRRLETEAAPSFFTSWDWIGSFLEVVPEASRPFLLRGRRDGETVALALLGQRATRRRFGLIRSRLATLNATGDPTYDGLAIEHNELLVRAGLEALALSALLAWFRAAARDFDELSLPGVATEIAPDLVARAGLFPTEAASPSYSVDLRKVATMGGFERSLSRNARAQLSKAVRQFEAVGPLQLTAARSVEEALAFFEELKILHRASWERRGKRHAFDLDVFEPFAQLLIRRCHERGTVELWRATAGEEVLGYLLNFRLRDHIYAYQSGFSDSDPHRRPGVVTHFLAIQEGIRSGAAIYDFMAGRNRLKESFATEVAPMRWYRLQQPLLRFRLETAARALKERLAALRKSDAG